MAGFRQFDELLQFVPIYQARVWGGRRLETIYGRALPDGKPYGESWELVDRDPDQSVVATGALAGMSLHTLWTEHREPVFGSGGRHPESPRFPLLIKILDCRDDLSIQVHPSARRADALRGEPKTEMWFVAGAEPGAGVYAGLRPGVTPGGFAQALETGALAGCIHRLQPEVGDSVFVPSGRVHALGAGLVVFEIQQNSDTTYRVFDWNRAGLDGRPRDLHVRESLQSIDFTDVEPALTRRAHGELAACEHFRVSRARTGDPAPSGDGRLIMPIAPTEWAGRRLSPGQVTLCPAAFDAGGPVGEWLEIEY